MKKISFLVIIIALMTLFASICYAGSVPEDILSSDHARLYFGEILDYHEKTQTAVVIPTKNIKGDIVIGSKQSLENCIPVGTKDNIPKKGEVCLIAYYDEVNPNYIFKTTSDNLPTLKIKNIEGMDMFERLQEYINDGSYTKAESERVAGLSTNVQAVNEIKYPPMHWFLYTKTAFYISLSFILIYIFLSLIKRRWSKIVQIIVGCTLTLYGLVAAGGAKQYFLYKLYDKWGDNFTEHIKEFIPWAIAKYSASMLALGTISIILLIIGAYLIKKRNTKRIALYFTLSFISIMITSIVLGFFSINKMFDIASYIVSFAYFVALWLFGILTMKNMKRGN